MYDLDHLNRLYRGRIFYHDKDGEYFKIINITEAYVDVVCIKGSRRGERMADTTDSFVMEMGAAKRSMYYLTDNKFAKYKERLCTT